MLYSSILFGLCLSALVQYAQLTSIDEIPLANIKKYRKAYIAAPQRIFFFDMDKVLVDGDGSRTSIAQSVALIAHLAKDSRNKVHIITARNPKTVFDNYGHIGEVGLAAGMGMLLPTHYSLDRQTVLTTDITPDHVKADVQILHDQLVQQGHAQDLDSAMFERKATGVLVNTKGAKDPASFETAGTIMREAQNELFEFGSGSDYVALNHVEANKGTSLAHFLEKIDVDPNAMLLSFGDSVTDEPMHEVINEFGPNGFSLLVDKSLKQSIAKERLENQAHVLDFVAKMSGYN